MKRGRHACVAFIMAGTVCVALAGCGQISEPVQDSQRAGQQNIEYERQLKISEDQLKRSEVMYERQERLLAASEEDIDRQRKLLEAYEQELQRRDALISKLERQAERFDRVLEQWEKINLSPTVK